MLQVVQVKSDGAKSVVMYGGSKVALVERAKTLNLLALGVPIDQRPSYFIWDSVADRAVATFDIDEQGRACMRWLP